MAVYCDKFQVRTTRRGMIEVTTEVAKVVSDSAITVGLVNVFVKHTSASIFINENADPDVRVDLERFMSDLVVDGDARFIHTAEGPDDMAAHIRSVLTSCSITVPIRAGRLALGTWQGVYLWEHRHEGSLRNIEVTVLG